MTSSKAVSGEKVSEPLGLQGVRACACAAGLSLRGRKDNRRLSIDEGGSLLPAAGDDDGGRARTEELVRRQRMRAGGSVLGPKALSVVAPAANGGELPRLS